MSKLTVNGIYVDAGEVPSGSISSDEITNDTIVNADVNSAAAIAYSKLAALTSAHLLVGSSGNVATDTEITGDISISNAGLTAISSGVIIDADVKSDAAIAHTKIASTGTSTATALTLGSASANAGVLSMIQGATASDPTFTVTQSGNNVTINQTVGDITITAAGGDIGFDNENLLTTGTLGAGVTTVTRLALSANSYIEYNAGTTSIDFIIS